MKGLKRQERYDLIHHCITKSSWVFVIHGEGFQPLVNSKCQEIIANACKRLCFLKIQLVEDWYLCLFPKSALIMMTSSNGNIFRVNGPLCGEFTGHRRIPRTKAMTRSFDVFFDPRLNKRLSKQSIRRLFETPSHSLWCQSYDQKSDYYTCYSFDRWPE